jgi:hypothetical protein
MRMSDCIYQMEALKVNDGNGGFFIEKRCFFLL